MRRVISIIAVVVILAAFFVFPVSAITAEDITSARLDVRNETTLQNIMTAQSVQNGTLKYTASTVEVEQDCIYFPFSGIISYPGSYSFDVHLTGNLIQDATTSRVRRFSFKFFMPCGEGDLTDLKFEFDTFRSFDDTGLLTSDYSGYSYLVMDEVDEPIPADLYNVSGVKITPYKNNVVRLYSIIMYMTDVDFQVGTRQQIRFKVTVTNKDTSTAGQMIPLCGVYDIWTMGLADSADIYTEIQNLNNTINQNTDKIIAAGNSNAENIIAQGNKNASDIMANQDKNAQDIQNNADSNADKIAGVIQGNPEDYPSETGIGNLGNDMENAENAVNEKIYADLTLPDGSTVGVDGNSLSNIRFFFEGQYGQYKYNNSAGNMYAQIIETFMPYVGMAVFMSLMLGVALGFLRGYSNV